MRVVRFLGYVRQTVEKAKPGSKRGVFGKLGELLFAQKGCAFARNWFIIYASGP